MGNLSLAAMRNGTSRIEAGQWQHSSERLRCALRRLQEGLESLRYDDVVKELFSFSLPRYVIYDTMIERALPEVGIQINVFRL